MPFGLSKDSDWYTFFEAEQLLEPLVKMENRLLDWRKSATIYPPQEDVLQVFKHCDIDRVKVVIIGQDPYHGEGQAHGLSFSVQKHVPIPPSLRNMYKELVREKLLAEVSHGDLSSWVNQGVFLLNSILTVEANKPLSHANIGWEIFTSACLKYLANTKDNLVFMLWGNKAQSITKFIPKDRGHLMLTAPHPSPLSAHRGFFGCGHFQKANEFLLKWGKEPIDWEIR